MTDKEKAIVMAYTGTCMLTGGKFKIFHDYVESIMGRPVFLHEMGIKTVADEIKEKAKTDFIALCAEQEPRMGHWMIDTELGYNISICSNCYWRGHGNEVLIYKPNYCPNCGAKMDDQRYKGSDNI